MSQMSKTLKVPDISQAKSVEDLKRDLKIFFADIQEAYRHIHNDIWWKRWVYFMVEGKKWRIGPVGDHLEAQYLTGTDWRNDSHWTMTWRSYGGT